MNQTHSTRTALWTRVQELMLDKWGSENQNRLAREAGVGVATIARMKTAGTSVGLDVVEKVASALGTEAWQLICPADRLHDQDSGFSPLALDLARSLDLIEDPDLHRRAYAVASQVLSFGSASYGGAGQESEKQPIQEHVQE